VPLCLKHLNHVGFHIAITFSKGYHRAIQLTKTIASIVQLLCKFFPNTMQTKYFVKEKRNDNVNKRAQRALERSPESEDF